MILYFKRPWNETRGDHYDHWGSSIWYFETNQEGDILRQIEVYENGRKLKYSLAFSEDEYGCLSDQSIDLPGFQPYLIRKIEFERVWIRE